MARIDDLDKGELRDLLRRVRALEKATPLNNASIGRNGLRVHDGGRITIENNGGITITGPDGQLIGSGTIDWTGPVNLKGDTDITGDTTISGALDVSGLVSLLSDLLVKAGGQITVEGSIPMQFGASVLGIPGVSFTGGGGLVGNGSGAALFGGEGVGSGAAVVTTSSTASLSAGTKAISVDSTRSKIDGGLELPNMPTKSGVASNVYIDPATFVVYRIV